MAVEVVAGASMSRPWASTSALACAPQDSKNRIRSCSAAMCAIDVSFYFQIKSKNRDEIYNTEVLYCTTLYIYLTVPGTRVILY